jgi:hypothetical protein
VFGKRNADKYAGRRRQLGLDADLCERALTSLATVLRDGPMERARVIEALAEDGVIIEATSQAPAHLLMLAASTGLVCRGPETDRDEPTYVLLDGWVPPTDDDPGDDLRKLATRYVAGYGPTGPADLAAWSGLPIGTARRAFADAGIAESAAPGSVHSVRLLGHFDNYLLGYRNRELTVDPAHDKQVQTGGGFIMPTVLVDGRAVATWRTTPRGDIYLEPFGTLTERVLRGVRDEVADIGRFLGKPVELVDQPQVRKR